MIHENKSMIHIRYFHACVKIQILNNILLYLVMTKY